MPSLDELRGLVRKDWEQPESILHVLDAILALPDDARRYLTIPLLKQLSELPTLRETTEIAEYLASDRIGLLVPHFELIVGDEEVIPLSDADVYEALKVDRIINPGTGEVVPNWSEYVIPYYSVIADFEGLAK
jgi:hypothetical protein